MPTFIKKPVAVEAIEWTGDNVHEVFDFMNWKDVEYDHIGGLVIYTLEGEYYATPGDMIIKGIRGEFYPCKPDIFKRTYYTEEEYAEISR